jgi:hypothetical protein
MINNVLNNPFSSGLIKQAAASSNGKTEIAPVLAAMLEASPVQSVKLLRIGEPEFSAIMVERVIDGKPVRLPKTGDGSLNCRILCDLEIGEHPQQLKLHANQIHGILIDGISSVTFSLTKPNESGKVYCWISSDLGRIDEAKYNNLLQAIEKHNAALLELSKVQ